jgi:hypothetical protein
MVTSKELTLVSGLTSEGGKIYVDLEALYQTIEGLASESVVCNHNYMATPFRSLHHQFVPAHILNQKFKSKITSEGLLKDSCAEAIYQLIECAELLNADGYNCNAMFYVVADSKDAYSEGSINDVKRAIARAISSEALESFVSLFIGVGDTSDQQFFSRFASNSFSLCEIIDESEKGVITNIPEFIADVIRAQNKALGSGGPSEDLTPLQRKYDQASQN